ncbi:hypothetical protein Ocin01_10238 [Orchesella cincta]|uniref:Uncharacterized protein n=1 Tax=Orchesella cincta TaxID=48709 RepID=A0A1D2MTJ3_ORCCI|nr:hypothetical protein Ocin01_10238 [Orchesella cincta]
MAHWVSEFHRKETPRSTTVVKISRSSEEFQEVTYTQRHITTLTWDSSSHNNNNNEHCRPSNYQRSTSRAFLYVRNHHQDSGIVFKDKLKVSPTKCPLERGHTNAQNK